jgi:hypothetical protein
MVNAGVGGGNPQFFVTEVHADTLPQFQLDRTDIDFGEVFITAIHVETVTVSNNSPKVLFISSVTVDSGEFLVTPNSGTVAGFESMQFFVSFAPTSEVLQEGNIRFEHNAAIAPSVIAGSARSISSDIAGESNLPVQGSGTTVDVDENSPLPKIFALQANYPNPFNPTTNIAFDLPIATRVTLIVYNTIGQQVDVLLRDAEFEPGSHQHVFDASALPTGIYFYRIQTPDFSAVRKMVLLK